MMRLEDSREAGLWNSPIKSATGYSSLETAKETSEFFDMPVSRRAKGKGRCYAASACILFIAVAATVSTYVVTSKKCEHGDSKNGHNPQSIAEAAGPKGYSIFGAGHGWTSSPPAPAVEATDERAASPLSYPSSVHVISPAPLSTSNPSSHSYSFDPAPYENICNKTINRTVCLNMFRSYPNSHKAVNLQQSTVMAMEAAEHALNDSYILAQGMKTKIEGNAALQQCIDVFAEALENVNKSMSLVAAMDVRSPSGTGADVQTFMSAAITNHDTCQEGIDEVGPFPGCDQITGQQAKHVDTMLSIALTFVNRLTTPTVDPHHHRRLLHTKPGGSDGIVILQFLGRQYHGSVKRRF